MNTPDEEGAKRAAQVASISATVVELGQERLRALQASGSALDQRVTQVAAFQLAAAALAGSLLAQDNAPDPTVLLAALACLAFVVGAFLSFLGMKAGFQQLPGINPAWWAKAADDPNFSAAHANEWIAVETERAISFNRRHDESRARWLNFSLIGGLIGGLLVVAAAFSRLSC